MSIVVVSTGGTIASPAGADERLSADDLVGAVPDLASVATVETREFARLPSTDLAVEQVAELADLVAALDDDASVDGVVVTHGTDVLEESALFVDLVYDGDTPVVFTGAMRDPSMTGPDGPANLLASVRVAASDRARGLGVLVVLGDRVHAAPGVTKTHSTAPDTFRDPEFGPLAVVDHDRVTWARTPVSPAPTYDPDPDRLTNDVLALAVGFDASGTALRAGVESAAVCVGVPGAGNLPPGARDALERLDAADVPVVATTRCPQGRLSEAPGDLAGLNVRRSERDLLGTRVETVVALAADGLDDAFEKIP
jgi:L-asparaginase